MKPACTRSGTKNPGELNKDAHTTLSNREQHTRPGSSTVNLFFVCAKHALPKKELPAHAKFMTRAKVSVLSVLSSFPKKTGWPRFVAL